MKKRNSVITLRSGNRFAVALFAFAAIFMVAETASAQLRVSSIDWVQGRPEIPHPALNNRATILMAIAEGGNCNGNYQYRWDINGDGDFDDGNEQWRGTNSGGHRSGWWAPLGLEITFPAQPGDRLFYPKVEVDCAGQRASTVVPYLVRVDRMCPNYPNDFNGGCRAEKDENIKLTRQYYYDRIVDRLMWWMFNSTNHYNDDGRRGGIHACVYWGGPGMYNVGHYLNVFLRRSHGYGPGRDVDAYYRHAVYCGLNALVGTYHMAGGAWFNDDGADGWDGWRMSYTNARLGGHWGWGSYGSTAWVEPVVNYGNADYRVPGGEGNVRGRSLRDLGGDLRDGILYCMGGSGQWFYSCRSDGHPDASTNGWAPESMRILGRKFGMNTYGWARDRQRNWLNGNCSHGSNNNHYLFGCRYHVHGPGGIGKLAGNALVGYGWTQLQDFNNDAGGARWRMREHWIAASRLDNVWHGLYFLYATTKGMRSFVPELSEMEGGRDWATEFAHYLVTHLVGDNYSNWCAGGPWGCHWCCRGSFTYYSGTALTAQMIQTWLEAQAMARANPQSTGPGIPVTFDHSWSHILDPLVTLTRFRWNVIDNGNEGNNGPGSMVWDFDTDDVSETFEYTFSANLGWSDVINKKITLEVTDSNGNTVYDDKSVSITLSLKNHKPVVVAHPDGRDGIYSGYFGQRFMLDASRSYETDQCIRDPEDPNLPGGSAEVIEPPVPSDVQIQDCDALENEMNRCLDNADPTNVNEILACVQMQYTLQDCRMLETELSGCNPLQAQIAACEALRELDPEEVEEDVVIPENCDPEVAAYQQCRVDSVNTVNATIDAANLAEFQAQQGGGPGGGEDADGNCGDREVFPGDGGKPRGIPDKITSICFDTNFNNRWCEAGEIQYLWPDGAAEPTHNDPVEFVPRAGMGEGDIIGVPVRVCDDGRWNGKCYQNGDGAPGHLTRGDCSECGYGTASLQVINNTTAPELTLSDPPAEPAKGRLTVGGAPNDGDFVDLKNAAGESKRIVFDHDTDQTSITASSTTLTVTQTPVEQDTFRLQDHTGNERRFVFRARSESVDGSNSDVLGIPHVQIGLSGAGGPNGVASRVATVINTVGALDITATANNNQVTLTQGQPTYSGNTPITTSGVNGMTTPPFNGGVNVGIGSVRGDSNGIAARVTAAVNNHVPGITASASSNVVTLQQQSTGFAGNTPISTDNVENVRASDFKDGRPQGYEVAPGQRIKLDLSQSRDPEGVLGAALDTNGVYYRYELTRGRGYILPERGYETKASGRNDNSQDPDDWSNWGSRPFIVPRGDGPVDMTVRVSARDVGGRTVNRDIDISLINEKPVMKSVTSDIFARAPSLDENQAPPIESRGNRRYRLVVQAIPDNGVDAVVRFQAVEKYGQDITVTADLDNDGNADADPIAGPGGTAEGEFRTTFRDMPPEGRTFTSRVVVSDGNDTDTKLIRVYVPAISPQAANDIRYSIDIGNDGSYEVTDSRQNYADFRLPPGNNSIEVAGAVSANGSTIPFNLGEVEMPNAPPAFTNPRLVSQDGFDVVVAASATDPDGDPVTITVDWGDGNVSRGRNVVYSHSYANARFQVYTVRVRATDDRGLFDEHVLTVDIVQPAIKEADINSLAWRRV
ncbi:MAG: PKD domain-containing protein, partial [Myxococcota bacterium]|nr:PKD domain-containing protein [Myxococcota bacterium]